VNLKIKRKKERQVKITNKFLLKLEGDLLLKFKGETPSLSF
jgi:hypothetical protein